MKTSGATSRAVSVEKFLFFARRVAAKAPRLSTDVGIAINPAVQEYHLASIHLTLVPRAVVVPELEDGKVLTADTFAGRADTGFLNQNADPAKEFLAADSPEKLMLALAIRHESSGGSPRMRTLRMLGELSPDGKTWVVDHDILYGNPTATCYELGSKKKPWGLGATLPGELFTCLRGVAKDRLATFLARDPLFPPVALSHPRHYALDGLEYCLSAKLKPQREPLPATWVYPRFTCEQKGETVARIVDADIARSTVRFLLSLHGAAPDC